MRGCIFTRRVKERQIRQEVKEVSSHMLRRCAFPHSQKRWRDTFHLANKRTEEKRKFRPRPHEAAFFSESAMRGWVTWKLESALSVLVSYETQEGRTRGNFHVISAWRYMACCTACGYCITDTLGMFFFFFLYQVPSVSRIQLSPPIGMERCNC